MSVFGRKGLNANASGIGREIIGRVSAMSRVSSSGAGEVGEEVGRLSAEVS